MSDLIRRKDAIEVVCELVPIRNDAVEIADAIRAIPSAERKGEWKEQHENGHGFWVGVCSQCGEEKLVDNYCSNCGARMEGAEDE